MSIVVVFIRVLSVYCALGTVFGVREETRVRIYCFFGVVLYLGGDGLVDT